jgi:hypothetical protein
LEYVQQMASSEGLPVFGVSCADRKVGGAAELLLALRDLVNAKTARD